MVICPKCCEYYQFQDVQHDRKLNRYVCVFSCDCPGPLRLEENEAEQKGFLVDEETQDTFREKKIEIIQALIRDKIVPPVSQTAPSILPGSVMAQRAARDEPSPS